MAETLHFVPAEAASGQAKSGDETPDLRLERRLPAASPFVTSYLVCAGRVSAAQLIADLSLAVGSTYTISFSSNDPNSVIWDNALGGTNQFTFTAAVPEPASLAMWGLGALGACVYTRRRKRRQA